MQRTDPGPASMHHLARKRKLGIMGVARMHKNLRAARSPAAILADAVALVSGGTFAEVASAQNTRGGINGS